MHPRSEKLVIASAVVALVAGVVYLLIPWQDTSLHRPIAGLEWVFANGMKFTAMSLLLVALALAIGTYVDSWING